MSKQSGGRPVPTSTPIESSLVAPSPPGCRVLNGQPRSNPFLTYPATSRMTSSESRACELCDRAFPSNRRRVASGRKVIVCSSDSVGRPQVKARSVTTGAIEGCDGTRERQGRDVTGREGQAGTLST